MKPTSLKRLDSESYRTYRVLRAPTVVGDVYRSRIKQYGNHRGAIIFPEGIFTLSCPIFAVYVEGASHDGIQVAIRPFSSRLLYSSIGPIENIEDLLEVENGITEEKEMDNFGLQLKSTPGYAKSHFTRNVICFTGRDHAVSYVNKTLGKHANRYL